MEWEKDGKKEWGLVLNGGGGKGAYQIGVFRALRELKADEKIAAVAGSSAGALNMCLWLFDDATCKAAWESISPEKLADIELDMLDGYEGMVSREGLLDIINDYVNLEIVGGAGIPLYATMAEYDAAGGEKPTARYMSLNGRTPEEIRIILLASTCLPFLYEPIALNGHLYRDGGLADNMPIKPLYDMGIRKMIVVCTSTNMPDLSAYPDVEFLVIRPSKDIGGLLTGTLDFSGKGVKVRMELGYMDGIRNVKYYGNPYANLEEIAAVELRQLESRIHSEIVTDNVMERMDKLKSIYDRYDF